MEPVKVPRLTCACRLTDLVTTIRSLLKTTYEKAGNLPQTA